MEPINHGSVIDIGGSTMQNNIGDRLLRILSEDYDPDDKPALPDELLYDDVGLPIWNEIIFTPEFYQTHDEIALLDRNGSEIAARFKSGLTIIDLGAGDTRKVEHLLAAFEKAGVRSTYLALDISKASLAHNVAYLAHKHSSKDSVVTCAGLWGTFDDGQRYAAGVGGTRLFLSLGSVLCNDPWINAVNHLRSWSKVMRLGDRLLVGMDAHMAEDQRDKLWDAYHAREDLYENFFFNGFGHANRLMGREWFRPEDWEIRAELENKPTTRHRFFLKARSDIQFEGLGRVIRRGEEFDWFDSHKYGENSVQVMCSKVALTVLDVWRAPNSDFRQYLIKLKDPKDPKDDDDSGVSGLS